MYIDYDGDYTSRVGPNVKPYHLSFPSREEHFGRETYLTDDQKFDEAANDSTERLFAPKNGILSIEAYAKWDEFLKSKRAEFTSPYVQLSRRSDTWLAYFRSEAEKKVRQILGEDRNEKYRQSLINLARPERVIEMEIPASAEIDEASTTVLASSSQPPTSSVPAREEPATTPA